MLDGFEIRKKAQPKFHFENAFAVATFNLRLSWPVWIVNCWIRAQRAPVIKNVAALKSHFRNFTFWPLYLLMQFAYL